MDKFGTGRFDRSVHMFARHPALAVPLLVGGVLMFGLSLPPPAGALGAGFFLDTVYSLFLLAFVHYYYSWVVTFTLAWQLKLLERIEETGRVDLRRPPRDLLASLRLVTALAVPGVWRLYQHVFGDLVSRVAAGGRPPTEERALIVADRAPVSLTAAPRNHSFVHEAGLNLALAAGVWRPELGVRGARAEGLRAIRVHFTELEKRRDRLPAIPPAYVLGLVAVAAVFHLLPESFMTMSTRWLFYPLGMTVLFSIYCAQMEWAAVYLRHWRWDRERARAEAARTRAPALAEIREVDFLAPPPGRRRAG